ncbi:hypothetical protein ACFQH6_20500 [Halobacteriaceae archaeon GCM10025711]
MSSEMTDHELAKIGDEINRLRDDIDQLATEQKRTADMLESLMYIAAEYTDSELKFETFTGQDYWTVMPPMRDDD